MAQDSGTMAKLEQVWRSIETLCESFTEREWKLPTDCPGWTVQDSVAHLVDYESRMMQRQPPDHTPPERPHVQNDLGRRNEIWIDWYRSKTGAEVLQAYRDIVAERLEILPRLTPEQLSGPSPASLRGESLESHLERRVVDCWAHEQDIRRSVSRPGHQVGPVVDHVMARMLDAMGPVVGRRAEAPEGSTVLFDLTGPYYTSLALQVEDGKAKPCDPVPALPTARLSMDSETFICLVFGRWEPDKVLESGRVLFAGDRQLGYRIVRHMVVTP
ncbi:maleylpyruvate isomerase family mycothiol-dependent enzyme [Candidatus Entotheonella palauensis]|nr:maleylpyruvate isomerase family mycothiol-dependent enzyme [Candidatus Entotheonella palauensis]